MLAVEVELLTGTYTATQFNDRNQPEWPPHPARLFSAMVAAWADADEPDEAEADALRWFEALGDPAIRCSLVDGETSTVALRSVTTHFVPVNDPAVVSDHRRTYEALVDATADLATSDAGDPKAHARATKARDKALAKSVADSQRAATKLGAPAGALELLPDLRAKQGRTYPTVRPDDPTTTFAWLDAEPDARTAELLDDLLGRVARLGHSSSLVSCRVVDEAPTPTLVPDPDGETQVRVPGSGQLDRLVELFAAHQGQGPRTLPSRMVRYGPPGAARARAPRSHLAGTWFAATIEGRDPLSIRASLPVARAVRAALLEAAGRDGATIAEVLSGHAPRPAGSTGSTDPSDRPHLAVVPLPFVGRQHADGMLKGIGFLLPTEVDPEERAAVHAALGRWLAAADDDGAEPNLWGAGLSGRWTIRRAPEDGMPITLRRSRWATTATTWASVTPIVLDRYPDGLWRGSPAKRARSEEQAVASVARACTNIGLPEPVHVEIRADAPVTGALPVRRHPPFRSGRDGAARALVHAVVEFAQPVQGPVLLGRGRYLGQGLLMPLREGSDG
ncbi:MAG TPA: type I-U CRISPR-associated protein Csb2 [Iamia sp.]|nr:type I-U CRISPR-associated protein Csb2 [Iamia sp.]